MANKSKKNQSTQTEPASLLITEAELNHHHTPPVLSVINKQISKQLSDENVNDIELLNLIEQRDDCVQTTLQQLAAAPEKQKQFALAETEVNNKLIRVCNQLVKQAQTDLTKLVKGRKAIRQYR